MRPDGLAALFPDIQVPALPFIAGYALRVESLAIAEGCLKRGGIAVRRKDETLTARFPAELGIGFWLFVEAPSALLWRRR
jgi:hypothetical protein